MKFHFHVKKNSALTLRCALSLNNTHSLSLFTSQTKKKVDFNRIASYTNESCGLWSKLYTFFLLLLSFNITIARKFIEWHSMNVTNCDDKHSTTEKWVILCAVHVLFKFLISCICFRLKSISRTLNCNSIDYFTNNVRQLISSNLIRSRNARF